ncbi:sugar ABC transporter substrate-binding protein [Metallosphaera javensis (ex Sakai et al. 2022)]|uniref:sugar ABC transporter substrate-binding protein n=1 Tax=Metallosphaera javensis (ex Sakai et al. 2022) TaxID=2775498 RepID=UPI0025854E0F|nr:MAG: hypothetical protein MjAS7_2173 [Metallosphaera javensis (ex Sakai et al. 2022)]
MNKYIPIIIALVIIVGALAGVLIYTHITTTTPTPVTSTTSNSTISSTLPPAAAANSGITIYMVTHGAPTDPFWIPVIEGAEYAAALLGIKVIYEAPSTFSISAMTQLLSSALAAKPDGLIISVPAPSAEIPYINQAYQEGIPVLVVNAIPTSSSYPSFPYNETIAYVGQDDYEAGVGLAHYIITWYEQTHNGQKPTNIVIFNHEPGQFSLTERIAGIDYVLNQNGLPNATVVPTNLNFAQSESIISSYLTDHPNTQVIITLGPAGTDPAVAALNQTGLAHKIALFSFDYDNTTINAIKAGIDDGTVDQQPMEQGFLSVIVMFMYIKLHLAPAIYNISTGPFIITPQNVQLIEEQNGETSLLSSYLKVGGDPNGVYMNPLILGHINSKQLLSRVTVQFIHKKGYYEVIINGERNQTSLQSLEHDITAIVQDIFRDVIRYL